MEKPSDPVQRLRESTIREAGTGRVLEKPLAPAMRVVEKGGWTYREVRPGHTIINFLSSFLAS
jgi:hypothetical protein